MTRKVVLGAGVAILIIAAAWRIESRVLAQAQTQAQAVPPQVTGLDPCATQSKSVECLSYRLDRVDRQLGQMQALIGVIQQRSAGGPPPGPPVGPLMDPGSQIDANSAYIQQRIDAISKTVRELVNRANAVR